MASVGRVQSPGPGAYNHRHIIGNDGLKKTFGSKRPTSAMSN